MTEIEEREERLRGDINFLKWQHSESRKAIRERKRKIEAAGADPDADLQLAELRYQTAKISADMEFAKLQLLKPPEERAPRSLPRQKKHEVDFDKMMRNNYNKFAGDEI